MTNPPRGTRDPSCHTLAHSRLPPGAAPLYGGHRRADQEPLERRLDNILDVEEPSRLLECCQSERQLQFQQLLRRYLSQILYGCTSAYCTTSTCLSCNERLVSRPFRAPTQLTARALAHYLASRDDPHRNLCPHALRVSPDSWEIDGTHDIDAGQAGSGSSIMEAITERKQTKKDPKSLGQNLYDTVTMIMFYSKQIPEPSSVFDRLRSPIAKRQSRSEFLQSSIVAGDDTGDASTRSISAGHVNGRTVVPAENSGNKPTEAGPRHSHHGSQTLKRPDAQHVVCGSLSNGQTVHKIKHLPGPVANGQASSKNSGPATLNDTIASPTARKSKMRSKAAALDTYISLQSKTVHPASLANHEQPGLGCMRMEQHPILPVVSHLTCDTLEQLKEEVYHHRNEQPSNSRFDVEFDTNRRFRPTKPFVNRSVFFALSDPDILLKSFHDNPKGAGSSSPLPHLDSNRLTHAFRDWNRRNGALVFDSLWIAVEALYRPPPEMDTQKSPRLKPSLKDTSTQAESESTQARSQTVSLRYLGDEEVAHIVMICIHALTSLVPVGWPHTWSQLRKFRSWGIVMPHAPPLTDFTEGFTDPWLSIIDELEYEPAIRLADRLLRGIGARLCFEHVLAALNQRNQGYEKPDCVVNNSLLDIVIRHLEEVERLAIAGKRKMKANINFNEDPGWTVTATLMEWLRTIIIKKWDGKSEINKWSSVGTAMTLLKVLHSNMASLNLRPQMFHIPYLNERVDTTREPVEFLSWRPHVNTFHVFDFPFLFTPVYLVGYFRTINFTTMLQQFELAERTKRLQERMDHILEAPQYLMLAQHLHVTLADYFVLDVNRDNVMEQTLNQLWGQEKRQLLKPLKVKLGMHEGEHGHDQGGVTCEFFHLVLSEAFEPNKGMFKIDPQTQMTWFQPLSFEPLWKFEMLGILFSLAVYNGITLPVTFPLVFYAGLSHQKWSDTMAPYESLTTDSIRDGWPVIAKALDELLAWHEGDVADTFVESFNFRFDAFGQTIKVDMQAYDQRLWPETSKEPVGRTKWRLDWMNWIATGGRKSRPDLSDPVWERPSGSVEDTPDVTNANRETYVKQYIHWLTNRSVAPQMAAFRSGFYTCLHPKSLEFFNAAALKGLVEGTQTIDVSALKKATHYEDGYSATHPYIKAFWTLVEQYSQDDRRRLLEFVTASERVPVTGFESMNFVIVRAGDDTDSLPTSSTCFGKLMLPEYASVEKLEGKLALAIQNAHGFGLA